MTSPRRRARVPTRFDRTDAVNPVLRQALRQSHELEGNLPRAPQATTAGANLQLLLQEQRGSTQGASGPRGPMMREKTRRVGPPASRLRAGSGRVCHTMKTPATVTAAMSARRAKVSRDGQPKRTPMLA